ncbi:hypothetical protein LTR27_000546 [Elasticomyces elasticus]|nr:hypothetical protein LTR27_000546 [Elasticomyces elasticus]
MAASRVTAHPQTTDNATDNMTALSTPPTAEASRNFIESIPPELQLRIFDHVGYDDALRLIRLNKYFHSLVKPEQWPFDDKAKFVQKAQLFPQHNMVAMRISPSFDTDFVFRSNGFACYYCFRVRPQASFSARQCIGSMGKHSMADLHSGTGCMRFCIPCALRTGQYRVRTLVASITEVRIDFKASTYGHESVIQTYCAKCNCLAHSTESLGNSTWCTSCNTWTKTRADRNLIFEFVESKGVYQRFFRCPQCGDLSMACEDEKRRCCYCKRDICRSCGCMVNKAGDWWCGLACSKVGWEFMQTTITDAWPLKLTLKDKIDEKHGERDPEKKKKTDLLDCEDVEEALSWLSL